MTSNRAAIALLALAASVTLFNGVVLSEAADQNPKRERPDNSPSDAKANKPSLSEPSRPNSDAYNAERIKDIAYNSREVRLVGPDQKEVEMKDDVSTRLLVALENFQKEASGVWGEVNERLDKGWAELKQMIEKNLAESKKAAERRERQTLSSGKEVPVVVSDVDGYSLADDDGVPKQQTADTTAAKIKDFLSNIGLNEENQKKASDTLSKAGASVSETMTKDLPEALKKAGSSMSETMSKDLPDALKKAGSAVSDTVTKDIPEAWRNIFG